MLSLSISADYLLIPVKAGAPRRLLTLFPAADREHKLYELEVPLAACAGEADWIVPFPVGKHRGETLLLCGPVPDEALAAVTMGDERPPAAPGRPLLHYAPENGWMNDPNGLMRLADGSVLLCYQFHPFGLEWGPMHWGSAKSRDLLHWETGDILLFPDAQGTMFSGGGYRDDKGDAGYGPGALLCYYTSAGGTDAPWSRDGVFTQRLAVSRDGGRTLEKRPGLLLPNLAHANRDPKVFYHPESGAYCMVLYFSENDFGVFRSPDLVHWEQTQFLTLPDLWECPDLFRLTAADGTSAWIFWSADGYYHAGSFAGFCFTPEQPMRRAYANKIPYAAQTVANEEGRVLSVAWLRLPNAGRRYTGAMAVPAELTLARDAEGWAVRVRPCRELLGALRPMEGGRTPESPWALRGTLPAGSGKAVFTFPGGRLTLDPANGTGELAGEGELPPTQFALPKDAPADFLLTADYAVFELYAAGGAVYAPMENVSPVLAGDVRAEGGEAALFAIGEG